MKKQVHTYNNSMGSFRETYWSDSVSTYIAPYIGEIGCVTQVITDTVESRYRLKYIKAGYTEPPFHALSVQYLRDASSLYTTTKTSKHDLLRVTYPQTWGMDSGGGLVDVYSYNLPEGCRGEYKWVMPCKGPHYPIIDHEMYGSVFDDKSKLEKIVKSLENDGPLYGEFFIYDGYGTVGDYCDHKSGEPHHGYKPTKEDLAAWRVNPEQEHQRHAILLLGTGSYIPHDGSSPKSYFVYENNWGQQGGMNGYVRILEDFLSEVWIPIVPSIPASTDPNAPPPKPLDTGCFATPKEKETSSS